MVGPEGLGRAGAPAAAADRLRPADYEEYSQGGFGAVSGRKLRSFAEGDRPSGGDRTYTEADVLPVPTPLPLSPRNVTSFPDRTTEPWPNCAGEVTTGASGATGYIKPFPLDSTTSCDSPWLS